MTEESFRKERRQQFLTERYFNLNQDCLKQMLQADEEGIVNLRNQGVFEPSAQQGAFVDQLDELKLHYTAGCDCAELNAFFDKALSSLERLTKAHREWAHHLELKSGRELRKDGAPLVLEDRYQYQLATETISLAVLLGRGDALKRIVSMFEWYRGTDLLFEALIGPAISDPRDNTDFFHLKPYDPLIDAFYTAETPEEAVRFMTTYLDNWYKSFEGLPGHNGHLKATEEYMPYYGYWSFEAAAICVIYGIDDTSFREHLVYPKDLADWARAHHSLNRLKFEAGDGTQVSSERLRCEAGQPCPREGEWETPAQASSRRRFKQGDVMPSVEGDYGQSIWQWVNDSVQ